MSAEWAAVYITVIGLIGTLANVFLTLSIQKSVLDLKLWATDKFVAKQDMTTYLSPIKDSIQMIGSSRRLQGLDPGHEPPGMRETG